MGNMILPVSVSKTNNKINNNTINFNGGVYSSIKTNTNNGDSFIKINKNKTIIGSIIGALAAATGFVLLAKSGKLGNKCQGFINNIFNFTKKTTPTSVKNKTPDIQIPNKPTFQPPKNKTPDIQVPNKLPNTKNPAESFTAPEIKPTQKLSNEANQLETKANDKAAAETINISENVNLSKNNVEFIENFEQTQSAIESLVSGEKGYFISIVDGEISSSNEELQAAINSIVKAFPDFKKLDETSMNRAFSNFVSVTQNESFKNLSTKDKNLLSMSALLEDIAIETKNGHWGFSRCDVLNLSEDITKNLTVDDEKTLFNLVDFMKKIEKDRCLEIPLFSTEEELNLVKILSESRFKNNHSLMRKADKAIESNLELIDLSDTYGQLIYSTPFDRDAAIKKLESNFFYKAYEKCGAMFDAYSIDLTKLPDTADVSMYGFPKGTTKKDLRFYIHMFSGEFGQEFSEAHFTDTIQRSKSYNFLWSKSLISPDYTNTFMYRDFGFITAPKIGQMHITYVDGRKSGYSKKIAKDLKRILYNEEEKDRLTALPNLVKKSLGLNDDEYKQLFKQLKKEGNIFEPLYDGRTFEVSDKKLTIDSIRKAVSESQDELFKTIKTPNNPENNEIIDESCDVLALIVKNASKHYNTMEINKSLKDYYQKTGKRLPIFII